MVCCSVFFLSASLSLVCLELYHLSYVSLSLSLSLVSHVPLVSLPLITISLSLSLYGASISRFRLRGCNTICVGKSSHMVKSKSWLDDSTGLLSHLEAGGSRSAVLRQRLVDAVIQALLGYPLEVESCSQASSESTSDDCPVTTSWKPLTKQRARTFHSTDLAAASSSLSQSVSIVRSTASDDSKSSVDSAFAQGVRQARERYLVRQLEHTTKRERSRDQLRYVTITSSTLSLLSETLPSVVCTLLSVIASKNPSSAPVCVEHTEGYVLLLCCAAPTQIEQMCFFLSSSSSSSFSGSPTGGSAQCSG
jgi:hypothetical protein